MKALGQWRREAARWLALAAMLVSVLAGTVVPAHAHGATAGVVEAVFHASCHDSASTGAPSDGQDEPADTTAPDHCLCCHAAAVTPSAAEPVRQTPRVVRTEPREQPRPADADPGRLREPPRPFA